MLSCLSRLVVRLLYQGNLSDSCIQEWNGISFSYYSNNILCKMYPGYAKSSYILSKYTINLYEHPFIFQEDLVLHSNSSQQRIYWEGLGRPQRQQHNQLNRIQGQIGGISLVHRKFKNRLCLMCSHRVLKCDVIKFSFLHFSIFMTIFQ